MLTRFTSGATPADLLVASMAAEPSLPHTCKVLVGLKTGSYNSTTHHRLDSIQGTDYIATPIQGFLGQKLKI